MSRAACLLCSECNICSYNWASIRDCNAGGSSSPLNCSEMPVSAVY